MNDNMKLLFIMTDLSENVLLAVRAVEIGAENITNAIKAKPKRP